MWVFVQWCLRREALNPWNYLEILFPLSVAGIVSWRELSFRWYPGQGTALLRILFGISASFIFVGGVRHASKAVCWEVSREQRDLVRLTGIEPNTLLWCKSLCRWWTIGLSLLLLFPLAMFSRTM